MTVSEFSLSFCLTELSAPPLELRLKNWLKPRVHHCTKSSKSAFYKCFPSLGGVLMNLPFISIILAKHWYLISPFILSQPKNKIWSHFLFASFQKRTQTIFPEIVSMFDSSIICPLEQISNYAQCPMLKGVQYEVVFLILASIAATNL